MFCPPPTRLLLDEHGKIAVLVIPPPPHLLDARRAHTLLVSLLCLHLICLCCHPSLPVFPLHSLSICLLPQGRLWHR